MLLAALGIYGLTAYTVANRAREIGIRIALGAQRADIIRLVLRHGLGLTVAGATIGLVLAAGAGQVLTIFLLGLAPIHAPTFAGAAVLFVGVGILASYLPARRALGIDPIAALRRE